MDGTPRSRAAPRRIAIAVALGLALAGGGAWLLARPGGEREQGGTTDWKPLDAPPGFARRDPPAPGSRPPASVPEFWAAIAAGDPEHARAAAAALRKSLRTDRAAWQGAAAALLAADTPGPVREALAYVLGTIGDPNPDALLLEALAKHGGDAAFARAAILALGAVREPEDDDDVFDLGDRPRGVTGPAGLGITVGREVTDPGVRAAMIEGFRRAEAPVRRAAAVALRGSLASPDARTAFAGALAAEGADAVAMELGETVLEGARRFAADAEERDHLVGLVLRRAGEDAMEGLRFRIEDDLGTVPLSSEARAALRDLSGPGHAFGPRAFGLTVLAGGHDAPEARGPLHAALGDPDAPVRDLAARLLSRLPSDTATNDLLAAAARRDPAWNVRFTAIETFAKSAPRPAAEALLEAATRDDDARVAARAAELLADLRRVR